MNNTVTVEQLSNEMLHQTASNVLNELLRRSDHGLLIHNCKTGKEVWLDHVVDHETDLYETTSFLFANAGAGWLGRYKF